MFDDAVVSTPLVEKLSLMAQGIPLSTLSVTSLSLTSSKILPGIWLPGIPTKWQGDAPLVRGGFRRIK